MLDLKFELLLNELFSFWATSQHADSMLSVQLDSDILTQQREKVGYYGIWVFEWKGIYVDITWLEAPASVVLLWARKSVFRVFLSFSNTWLFWKKLIAISFLKAQLSPFLSPQSCHPLLSAQSCHLLLSSFCSFFFLLLQPWNLLRQLCQKMKVSRGKVN